jgi:hypothetical protein
MKVSKVRTTSASPVRKKSKAQASGDSEFAGHLDKVAGHPVEPVAPVESAALGALGSVLAAQEVSDEQEREARRHLLRHGDDILDRLDEIRRDILTGAVPKERLANLAQILRAKKSTVSDPRLRAIIGEIELRAEVEIAKLTRKI